MEIWKKITHLDLAYEVEVSNQGKVRKIVDGNIHDFSTSPNSRGYVNIKLNHTDGIRYNHTVHRLVAITFLGLRKELVVNHIDGNRLNNNITNLEWVTRSGNMVHAQSITHLKRGREFSDEEVIAIINEFLINPITSNELATKLNVSSETLRNFFNRRSKKLITEDEYKNLRLVMKKNSNYGKNI
jgi:hypothetical protein